MIIIGIDPGMSGAISALDNDGRVMFSEDLQAMRDGPTSWIDGAALRTHLDAVLAEARDRQVKAYIERVHSMPSQGVSTMFTFGAALGSILGVVQAVRIPIQLVTPQTWKRAMGLTLAKDEKQADKKKRHMDTKLLKERAIHKARLLYPGVPFGKTDDAIAEALLLAHYGRATELGGSRLWDKPQGALL